MKKIIIASLLIATASIASAATSVQVEGGRTYVGADRNVGRVGVSTSTVLGLTAEADYTRTFNDRKENQAASLVVRKDLVTVAGVTVDALAGGQFATTDVTTKVGTKSTTKNAEGFGVVYGLGARYPLTTNVDVVADFRQVRGQNRIKAVDGNTVAVGVSYKF